MRNLLGFPIWSVPICLVAMIWSRQVEAETSKPPRPNFILILADDLGYGDLGCYGHPRFRTPRLDRLAAEGVRWTHANTPAPFCAPTRAALLTGRYPFRCGLTANPAPDAGAAANSLALPAREILLPRLLGGAGYATAMIGKWHLGHEHPASLPTRRGFDEYFGIPYSNDMRPVRLLENEEVVEEPVEQRTLTQRYDDRAVRFIEDHRDRPFFLYLAHAMPHKPLACSDEFVGKSGAGLYGDVLLELDRGVGRILDAIDRLQLCDRTIVLFTSDNGPWYGGSTGGLRGMKATSWEGGFRVPLIARWPGHLPAARVSARLVSTMDLFTTVLDAAGVAAPADRILDGRNLFRSLNDEGKPGVRYLVGQKGPRPATIRDGRWKLHLLPQAEPGSERNAETGWVDPRGPDGRTILAPRNQFDPSHHPGVRTGDPTRAGSLFDLERDPAEQHDVAGRFPEVIARLEAALEGILARPSESTTPLPRH